MLITIGSITAATRLVRLIERDIGSPASVIHTPSSLNKGGCSYSVRFNDRYETAVRGLIRKYQISVKRFYYENNNGRHVVYNAVS